MQWRFLLDLAMSVRNFLLNRLLRKEKTLRCLIANLFAAVVVIGFVFGTNPVAARQPGESFADLAEKSLPAVVNISTTQNITVGDRPDVPPGTPFEDFFKEFLERNPNGSPPRQASSLGSGFVIDPSGIVVTNNHVIAGADEIVIRFQDDLELPAKVLGRDPKTDLAVLKVESETPLAFLKIGDSRKIRVGDWVIAIGNPFGLGGSVSAGIISARQRDIRSGPYDDYLQTDAAINKGNSGGPMLNMDGEVIGVNSAIYFPTGGSVGIGFAVPTSLAAPIIDQLQRFGETRRGWLGVHIQTVTDEIAKTLGLDKARGALVASVAKDGPAMLGGIKEQDIILKFNGIDIDKVRRLPRIVAETKIGSEVPVVVWRDKAEEVVRITVARLDEKLAKEAGEEADPSLEIPNVGLMIAPLSDEARAENGIEEDTKGALIVAVQEEGPAAQENIRPGDVIIEVNQDPVSSPLDVRVKVAEAIASKRKSVLLLINRKGTLRFVAVKPTRE
ncbi:MAG: Do family serine endopeptidase [Alphaproteobacteria bacterium]